MNAVQLATIHVLVTLITVTVVSCTGGESIPRNTNMGGVEATSKVRQFILDADKAALGLAEEIGGSTLALRPDECRATGFDEGLKAWEVQCSVTLVVDGEPRQDFDMDFLVDDRTGLVETAP